MDFRELVCYAWAVARLMPDDDTLSSSGVELLRKCLFDGLNVRQAAEQLLLSTEIVEGRRDIIVEKD